MKKLSYNYIKKAVGDNGFALLSKKYINKDSKLELKCKLCSYIWETSFSSISRNFNNTNGCPKCSKRKKYTLEEVDIIVKDKGMRLVSKKYNNNSTLLEVICICGEQNKQSLNSIIRGSLCKNCGYKKSSNSLKFDFSFIENQIKQLGGTLLSKYYNGSKQKLKIYCKKCDNIFYVSFDKVKRGQWCSICSNIGKIQIQIFYIIKEIYPNNIVKYNYKAKWLGRQHIDIAVLDKDKNIILAIEYDGRQHFGPVCFGGMSYKKAKIEFLKTKERDKRKNNLIKKYNNKVKKFIRFSYLDKINSDAIKIKIKEMGIIG